MVADLNQIREQKQEIEQRREIERLSRELGISDINDTFQVFRKLTKETFDDMQQSKNEYIKQNQGEWVALGELYERERLKLRQSRNKVAKGLCISPGRLKRFEEGKPVADARLIARCYSLYLTSETRALFEGSGI